MNDQDTQLIEELRQIMQALLDANKDTIHKMVEDTVAKKLPEVERTNQQHIEQVVDDILSAKLGDKLVKIQQSLQRKITEEVRKDLQKNQQNVPSFKQVQDEYSKLQDEIKQIREELDELKSSSQGEVRHVSEHNNTVQVQESDRDTRIKTAKLQADEISTNQTERLNIHNYPTQPKSSQEYRGVLGKIQQSIAGTPMETSMTDKLLSNYASAYDYLETDKIDNVHIWLVILLEFLKKNKQVGHVKFDTIDKFNSTLKYFGLDINLTTNKLGEFSEWLKYQKDNGDPKLRNTSSNGGVMKFDKYNKFVDHVITDIIPKLINPPSKHRSNGGNRNHNKPNK